MLSVLSDTTTTDPENLPVLASGDLDEARSALAVYRAAPRRSSARAINEVLAKLVVAFPAARLSDVEAKKRVELYAEQLADLPADLLMAGAIAAIRTQRFFPTIAELRESARTQPITSRMWRERVLAALVGHSEAQAALPAPQPMAEEISVKALLGEFTQSLMAKSQKVA